MLHLCRREGLGECIGDHVICGAIDKLDRPLLHDPADPVVTHIDVLGARVVLVVMHEGDGHLVVRKEGGRALDVAKHLRDEVAEPEGFLAAMHRCDVLTLGGGQGDNLLLLRRP